MTGETDRGRLGEFLASYILESYGIEVHHVDRAGADLWCRTNNNLLTVQVKAASKPIKRTPHDSRAGYRFQTKNISADYFCFVALDLQLLLARPAREITASSLRIYPDEFTLENQRHSVEVMSKWVK